MKQGTIITKIEILKGVLIFHNIFLCWTKEQFQKSQLFLSPLGGH